MASADIHTEEHRVPGSQLVERAKALIHEGNVRRLIVRNDQGHTVLEVPLTAGVVGTLLAPVWAALGAIAALAAHYTLIIERRPESGSSAVTASPPPPPGGTEGTASPI